MDTQSLINISAKALSPILSPIAQSLISLITDITAERKQKRFEEFVNQLHEELKQLTEKINNEVINHADFPDVFEYTAKSIVNERIDEKRHFYQRIFVTGIISKSVAFDDVEQCIRLIESMTSRNILALRILSNPEKRNEELSNPIKKENDSWGTTTLSKQLQKLFPDFNGGELLENIKDLEFQDLLQPISANFQTISTNRSISALENHLTLKGERLVAYLRL